MDRFFDNYITRGWFQPFRWLKQACVDVIDKDTEIIVKAELPGVEKKDLDISVTKNSVTIRPTRQEETEEKGDYYHSEISQASYQRTLMLPSEVFEGKANAKFKDGILKITLPKMGKATNRKITVE